MLLDSLFSYLELSTLGDQTLFFGAHFGFLFVRGVSIGEGDFGFGENILFLLFLKIPMHYILLSYLKSQEHLEGIFIL